MGVEISSKSLLLVRFGVPPNQLKVPPDAANPRIQALFASNRSADRSNFLSTNRSHDVAVSAIIGKGPYANRLTMDTPLICHRIRTGIDIDPFRKIGANRMSDSISLFLDPQPS
jgi:hypothetical protein